MLKIVQFLIDNKAVVIPFLGLCYSEFLSLNPKYKSNGIIQAIGNLLKK